LNEFVWCDAWTVVGALAPNLLRWTQLIGLPDGTIRAARTLRRQLLGIARRLTRHGRSWTLPLPPAGPRTATTWIQAYPDIGIRPITAGGEMSSRRPTAALIR
jgi:hypothetical protein